MNRLYEMFEAESQRMEAYHEEDKNNYEARLLDEFAKAAITGAYDSLSTNVVVERAWATADMMMVLRKIRSGKKKQPMDDIC